MDRISIKKNLKLECFRFLIFGKSDFFDCLSGRDARAPVYVALHIGFRVVGRWVAMWMSGGST